MLAALLLLPLFLVSTVHGALDCNTHTLGDLSGVPTKTEFTVPPGVTQFTVDLKKVHPSIKGATVTSCDALKPGVSIADDLSVAVISRVPPAAGVATVTVHVYQ